MRRFNLGFPLRSPSRSRPKQLFRGGPMILNKWDLLHGPYSHEVLMPRLNDFSDPNLSPETIRFINET